jgi:N-acyl-D-aspartate/D-glutamate deacylase
MLTLKIANAFIVDGSGAPGFAGEIGIQDGVIAAIGADVGPATEEIDAAGMVVAPGFIDIHTHYDAQAFWDPTLSPSCFHGVTTIIGGYCGFSIAPLCEDAGPYLQRMLSRVEGMPLATLQQAVPWDWQSFGDFLGRLDGKIGLNAGFFCGHSALRRVVMGARAVGDQATPAEIDQMKALLAQSIQEGALGFSSSRSRLHLDGEGRGVPSTWASRSELLALAAVVGDYEGTGLEMAPDPEFPREMAELFADFSAAGKRAVNWNVLALTSDNEEDRSRARRQLDVATLARERGGKVIALTIPYPAPLYINLENGVLFDALPGLWEQIFRAPIAMRIAAFRDPAFRALLAAEVAGRDKGNQTLRVIGDLENYEVSQVFSEGNKVYEGRRLADIGAADGRTPLDVLLDVAIVDDLRTVFKPDVGGNDLATYKARADLWEDDRTIIGASDAGAHIDMIDSFSYATMLLDKGVREHKVIGLEKAVWHLTAAPADYLGLVGRGRLKTGYHADLVIFDRDRVASGAPHQRRDMPGDGVRIYADAVGIEHVLVNGTQVVRHGQHTGAMAGAILRSGKDTVTVAIDEPVAA